MSSGNEINESMGKIIREAEKIIKNACDTARQEAELEMERVLREYDQKTKHIMLRIRQDARAKALNIANEFGAAIIQNIDKTACETIDAVTGELIRKAGELNQKIVDSSENQINMEKIKVSNDVKAGEENSEITIRLNQNTTLVSEPLADNNTDIDVSDEEVSEEFEQWLTQ